MQKYIKMFILTLSICSLAACTFWSEQTENVKAFDSSTEQKTELLSNLPHITSGETLNKISIYTDTNGDSAVIPAEFKVSNKNSGQFVSRGLVVIAPDNSEYVWIPVSVTPLAVRDFGRYLYGSSFSDYYDETNLDEYKEMITSTNKYGGFYIGRYESGRSDNGTPVSKRITADGHEQIWTRISPQDAARITKKLYPENKTVQGFLPWGINWDTMLQWIIDSGSKTKLQVVQNSTDWGNYSDDSFSIGADGKQTGVWKEAAANNIYDLAGNNWEWTQERYGSNYVIRGGGYSLMNGGCSGSSFPASIRDPLPGNNHHPNVTFRTALYIK